MSPYFLYLLALLDSVIYLGDLGAVRLGGNCFPRDKDEFCALFHDLFVLLVQLTYCSNNVICQFELWIPLIAKKVRRRTLTSAYFVLAP